MTNERDKPAGIEAVLDEEKRIIDRRRERTYPGRDFASGSETNLIGLALSGGGIRSAVTNLGVLYEMSRVGLFRVVDYLSTVSGGGYIGCCIASLLSLKKPAAKTLKDDELYSYSGQPSELSLFSTSWSRFPFRDLPVSQSSTDRKADDSTFNSGRDTPYCRDFTSRDQVFHLRDRASYLIPSSLPFGSHVIRALGSVCTSTLLSVTWFAGLLVALTTVFMLLTFPVCYSSSIIDRSNITGELSLSSPSQDQTSATGIMKQASGALDAIKANIVAQTKAFHRLNTPAKPAAFLFGIGWGILAPFCMSRRGRTIQTRGNISKEDHESFIGRKQLKCISWISIILMLLALLVSRFDRQPLSLPDPHLFFPLIFSLGCLIGNLIMNCMVAWSPYPFSRLQNLAGSDIGWNRCSRGELSLCSGIFIYCLLGSALFALLPAFILAGNSGFIALAQAGLILGLRYYLTEKRKNTNDPRSGKLSVLMVKIKTWLMWLTVPLVVLLAIIGIGSFLGGHFFEGQWPTTIGPCKPPAVILTLAGSLTLAWLLSHLNFNNVSPHVFYKDRLSEAFLATFMRCHLNDPRTGDTNSMMGLARNSVEMKLTDLHGNESPDPAGNDCAARGPYLLINATLNLTAARDLQGFRRQSENFLLSRCYTGSERTGFQRTSSFDPPIELGRAMTISGAALTSVMGAQGSLAESFACTILGVRLGYWLRNPADMAKSLKRKTWNWKNLFYELFRYTDSRDTHVYLSDGGHCGDNLGLLALLKRRTKLIIASDAECDPEHVFDSLNNSIRRAYVDQNIKIHISLDELTPNEKRFTGKHYAIGRIIYPDRPWQKSWLLVIKNTMTGRESSPILNYRKKSPDFPHETTADQFFTEEQFEVYRSLGREACMEIWRDNISIFRSEQWLSDPWSCIDRFCRSLVDPQHDWDDVIRAVWISERGDFTSWDGFYNTIKEIALSECQDGSNMVQQLHELHRWLKEHRSHFDSLQRKFDIPRNWDQFKGIRYHLTTKNFS